MKRFILLLLCMALLLAACNPTSSDNSEEESSVEIIDDEAIVATGTERLANVYPKIVQSQALPLLLKLQSVKITTYDDTDEVALISLRSALETLGADFSDDAALTIHLGDCTDSAPDDEGYVVETTEEAIYLSSKGARGQLYAVNTFLKLLDGLDFYGVLVEDYPATPLRGVVEGFYGEPWSFEDRLSIISFCGDMKMNTYIYAPKDDLKHRSLWREAYSADELNKLKTLVDTANSCGVDFVFSLSPGLDMNYSESGYTADFAKMMDKFEAMYNIGVRHFALFLDDLPSRTAATAANHARLVNDFRQQFYAKHNDIGELMTVFVEYFDQYISDNYSGTLAAALNEDVLVMWTGDSVVDTGFNANSFDKPNQIYNRKMLLWWNYPVNDYTTPYLYLDGLQGMNSNVFAGLSGFISNPMNQAEASKLPLFTVADFIWNPKAFASVKSYSAAFQYLYPEIGDWLKQFAEIANAGIVNGYTDSRVFKQLIDTLRNNHSADTSALKAEFQALKDAVDELLARKNDYKIIVEIEPWLCRARILAESGLIFCNMLGVTDMEEYWQLKLDFYATYNDDFSWYLVSGDVLEAFFKGAPSLADAINGINYAAGLAGTLTSTMGQHLTYAPKLALDGDPTTFFWTACAPEEAADGGSFMLELETQAVVNTIFIATGNNGDEDRLLAAKIEVSTDKSTWTEVYSGDVDSDFFLEGLDVQAKYIRVTSTKPTKHWLKLRSFEVNGAYYLQKTSVEYAQATITTNMSTYDKYAIDFANDGDDTTYFWSGAGAAIGEYIQLDLGEVTDVFNIYLNSGAKPDDYFNQGHIEYSSDGANWTKLGSSYTTRIVNVDCAIKCRYIRYVSDINQQYWVTVTEFAVNKVIVSDAVSVSIPGNPKNSAYMSRDNNYSTYYQPIREGAASLEMAHNGALSAVEIFVSQPCDAKVYVQASNGERTQIGTLDSVYNLFEKQFDNVTAIIIEWQNTIAIHEIVIK